MAAMRQWALHSEDYESDEAFRDAAAGELAALENMMYRLGRGFVVVPIREQVGDTYPTVGYVFSEAVVPAVRRAESEPAPAEPTELTAEEMAEHFPEQEPVAAP